MIGYGLLANEKQKKFVSTKDIKLGSLHLEDHLADNSEIAIKPINPNLFMQGMYLEIKRLFGMYGRR